MLAWKYKSRELFLKAQSSAEEHVNSYIVRIYREEKDNPRNFVGTVEEVGRAGKRAFISLDELWAILNPVEKQKVKEKRRKKQRV